MTTDQRFYVAHTGQSHYGVYDRHGGSSPVATGMSEEMAKRVAELLSRDAEIAALKQRVAELERELAGARGVTQADSARLRAAERRVYDDPDLTFGCDAADHMADMVLELRQHNAELELELEAARKVASCLHDFATAHEKWEAALIMDGAAWSGGMAALPTLNETLYDGMMELQRQRNLALAAYRAAQTKEPSDEKAE